MNFIKLAGLIGQAIPSLLKLFGLFGKGEHYTREEIDTKARSEAERLKAWKDQAEVERERVRAASGD